MRANFALTLFVLLILVDCFQDRALCDENGLCSAVRLWVPMLKIPNTHCKTSASFLQCRCNIDDKLRGEAELNNSQQWLALNIEAGFPVIDAANSGQFIPQATNLQALGGISFKKGCYTGQEMVARAKFRGANKRALWLLKGSASRLPEAGEDLELKMGENWRRTGTVLAAVKLEDGQVVVQVVMNNDMEPDSIFRVRDDANTLRIEPLPYSLEE